MGGKHRIVGPDGKVEKNKAGTAVDGGGHDSAESCQKQAAAINSNESSLRQEFWNPRKWDGSSKVPADALWFKDQGGTVEFAKDGESQTFTMDGYTGAGMPHPFFGMVYISVKGVKFEKKTVGVLREHARDRIVGFGTPARRDGHIVIKNGKFSQVTTDGQEVAGLCAEGFPWECSINIDNAQVVDLLANEKMEVNGAMVKGPAVVFAKSRLREVSFCSLGMDAGTSVAATDGEEEEISIVNHKEGVMPEEKNEEPKVDLDALKAEAKEEGKKELVAHFDALCAAFDRDFAVEMFQAGKSLDEAKMAHYEKVKAELEELKAAKPEAKAEESADELDEPVPTGTPPKEDKPKDLKAAALAIQKERNAGGEKLTLGQAMKLAMKQMGKNSDKEV